MRTSLIITTVIGLSLSLVTVFSSPSIAADKLVIKQSNYSVTETLDRLTKILKSKGVTIFARVNHTAGAKKVGMALRPTQVLIFGNPKMGTPLMLADQRIGLALPLKALAYEDKDKKVWLSYRKADDLKQAYNILARDKVFGKMKGALGKLTDKAVAKAMSKPAPRGSN
ncbi:MAG: DUF302 domain-containing protein [bacterium]|nr:DUF302 domain-containing protein [bacterium]